MKKIIFSTLIVATVATRADYLVINKNVSLVSQEHKSTSQTLELPNLDHTIIRDSIYSPNTPIEEITENKEKLSLEKLLQRARNTVVEYRESDDGSYEKYMLLNDSFPMLLKRDKKVKVITGRDQAKNINFGNVIDQVDINDSTIVKFVDIPESPIINYLTTGITYRPSYNIYMDGDRTSVNGYFTINNNTENSYSDVDVTIINANINTNFQQPKKVSRKFSNVEVSYSMAKVASVDTATGLTVSDSKDYFIYKYPKKISLKKKSDMKFNFANLHSSATKKYYKKKIDWYTTGKDIKFNINNVIPGGVQTQVIPAGIAYVYERQEDGDIFVGTVEIKHTAPNNKLEFSSQKSNLVSIDSSSYTREKIEGMFNNRNRYKEKKSISVKNDSQNHADIIMEVNLPSDLIKLKVSGAKGYKRKGNLLTIKYRIKPSTKQKIQLEIIR